MTTRSNRLNSSTQSSSFWHWSLIPLLIALFISGLGIFAYYCISGEIEQETQRTLIAIAEQKRLQIEHWIVETRDDAEVYFSGHAQIAESMERWQRNGQKQDILESMQTRLDQLAKIRHWSNVTVFDQRARPIVVAGENHPVESYLERVTTILQTPHFDVIDIHLNVSGEAEYSLLAPIQDTQGVVLGVVCITWPVQQTLLPLVASWPIPSQTAESYLVKAEGDEVVFLTSLRHRANVALIRRMPLQANDVSPAQAARGHTGFLQNAHDYRGEAVLSYVVPITGTSWLMLTEIDEKEAMAGIRQTAWITTAIVVLVLILLFVIGYLLRRGDQQRQHLADRARFRDIFEEAPFGLALFDASNGRVEEINQHFIEILGHHRADNISLAWVTTDESAEYVEQMAQLQAGHISAFHLNRQYLKAEGEKICLRLTIATITSLPTDSRDLYLCMIEDITQRKKLEHTMQLTLQRLELANAAANIGIWDWNLANNTLEWDTRQCALYGITPEEKARGLNYQTWYSRLHHEDREAAENQLWNAVLENSSFTATFRITRPDGSIGWIYARSVLEHDQAGQPLRMIGISQDITLQKQQQEALIEAGIAATRRAYEQRLGSLIEQGLAGFVETDLEGTLLRVNDRYCEILGYSREALLGRNVRDITHPDDRELSPPYSHWPIFEGCSRPIIKRYLHQQGHPIWVNFSVSRVPVESGEDNHLIALVIDIDAFKQSEERLQLALEASKMGIYDWDLVTGQLIWSRQHEVLWGYQPGEFDGTYNSFSRRLHPDDLPGLTAVINHCRANQQAFQQEFRIVWPDGSLHWIQAHGEFFSDDRINRHRIRGTVMDVTARKQAEFNLIEQQQLLTEAQRVAHLGSWFSSLDGSRIQWSEETYRVWGVSPDDFELSRDSLISLVHPEDQPLLQTLIEKAIQGEEPAPHILRRLHPDGRVSYVSGQGRLQYDAQGLPTHISGTAQDITESYCARTQLQDSEQRFRTLFEYLPLAYLALDSDGICIDANQNMVALLGLTTPEQLLAQPFSQFWDFSMRSRFQLSFEKFKLTRSIEQDLLLNQAHGEKRIVQMVGLIQSDAYGSFLRAHCILLDVTERRTLENEIIALNADLEQKVVQRTAQLEAATEAKSQFLANMSHEIRTPMNAVLGFIQMLEEEVLSSEARDMVNHIRSAGRSLLAIVNDILDFSKIEAGRVVIERYPFQLAELLKYIHTLFSGNASAKGINLQLQDETTLSGSLVGDSQRLEQILTNLISNAIKFTEQGDIIIRVQQYPLQDQQTRLRFEIRDSGIGMSVEQVSQLFTPYHQADSSITRRFGGTGLGLAISKRLVELMGGQIGVESSPGQGSTFWVELPFDHGQQLVAADTAPAPQSSAVTLDNKHILVVDDVHLNRFLAEKTLVKRGARVTQANDGREAVELLRTNPNGFDLVLMDIQMPVMDGFEATRIIRQELGLNDLPILALTANVLAEEREKANLVGMSGFLSKPIHLAQLVETVNLYCSTYPD